MWKVGVAWCISHSHSHFYYGLATFNKVFVGPVFQNDLMPQIS